MAKSFILHSQAANIKNEDSQYLIHLLEAFTNITFSDLGIEPLLTVYLIAQFGLILDGDQIEEVLGEHYAKIAELSLRVLGNMSMNQEGKQ